MADTENIMGILEGGRSDGRTVVLGGTIPLLAPMPVVDGVVSNDVEMDVETYELVVNAQGEPARDRTGRVRYKLPS